MSSQKSEWFTTWFDSPFYHLLYKNHDDNEAQEFLDALIVTLKLEKGRRVLDLGCGYGPVGIALAKISVSDVVCLYVCAI